MGWLPVVLSMLGSVVYLTVVFATPTSTRDAFVLLLFYAAFIASPAMVALGRKEAARLFWGIGVMCPLALEHPEIRAMYGLASLLFSFRLIVLLKGISLFKTMGTYIVFVHSYHDLRLAYKRSRVESAKSLGLQAMLWGPAAAASGFVGHYLLARCQESFNVFLLVGGAACFAVYACASLYMLDVFYRTWLVVAAKDAPCVMQSPWRASSVSEFWSRRWNSTMQQLFKETCVLDPRRPLGVFAIFLTSSLLHVYPLLLLGLSWKLCTVPVIFFILQGCAVVCERRVGACRGRLWTTCWILLTASLSIAIGL